MYKILSGINNKRLYDWAEENIKIDESHVGFHKGYSAVDNSSVYKQWFKSIYLKRGRFYCIYVHFCKAFDKINHNRLFVSLEKKEIHVRFMHTLRTLYMD